MMRFSLQEMVRQSLAEAEERIKVAQLQQEPDRDEAKKDDPKSPSKEAGNTPERNYEGVKTASSYVEKLASAVEYLNRHYLVKEAVGEPEPAMPHTVTPHYGPGIGATALENNADSPTAGRQSEQTGEAKSGKPPMTPGQDTKSPGQTNPSTALETTMATPPGGSEDWTKQDKMKQAQVRRILGVMNKMAAEGAAQDPAMAQLISEHEDEPGYDPAYGRALDRNRLTGSGLGMLGGGALGGALGYYAGRKIDPELAVPVAALGSAMGMGPGHDIGQGIGEYLANRRFGAQPAMIRKQAGEDTAQAHISAGSAVPPDSSKSEEGVPSLPGEASRQESYINSNEAARDYTKQQAKAVPKERMGEVIDEPAQKKSTDPVLQQNLDNTGEAGVKISSAVAARALLRKIAEEGAKDDASPEEKERAAKLREALQAKQEEKKAAFGSSSMPISGGY